MNDVKTQLDARGLNCPLPILRTKKTLNGMQAGEVLEILATDPGSVKDMESFCQQTGNEMLSAEESGESFSFLIRKQ